jgi:hypothetical protein
MTMLSPGATYHAELREQLAGVGRALSVQRAILWLARGLAVGTIVDLGIVLWAWTRDGISGLPLPVLATLPLAAALLFGLASLIGRHDERSLARRVDRAAALQERSVTALELGARGDEQVLALAQMRDAVEHLRRLDPLAAFPIRVPKPELMTTVLVGLVAVLLAIAPNPWLLRQRAANPAANVAREQAQRVDRLADSLHPEQSQEIQQLRDLVRKGARTIDARSNEPESALNALEDLEQQIRDMSVGDDQLSAALSAIASALAADPNTEQLADAINTGDLRQVAQAAKDLAQRAEQLDGDEKAQVARVLRDASSRASRASPGAAGDLADAAAALSGGQAGADSADDANSPDGQDQQGQQGMSQAGAGAQNGRSAQEALNSLSSSAAAAAERQRAASQLEGSRNALERALGRTQSRSASGASSSSSGRSSSRNQSGQNGDQSGDGTGQGQASDQSGVGDQGSGGSQGGDGSTGGDDGQGGGYSTGGTPQNRTGQASQMDAVTTPQQDTDGAAQPDYSMENPYLGDAGDGSSRVGDQSVNPSFQRGKATQGNDQTTIPLGLRDLVKDYFSSLGQK